MKLADRWKSLIDKLTPGMTQAEAARYLNVPVGALRVWLLRFNYPFVDGRKRCWSVERRNRQSVLHPDDVDWGLANVVIARKFGVSRERVRQVRNQLKIRKVGGRN